MTDQKLELALAAALFAMAALSIGVAAAMAALGGDWAGMAALGVALLAASRTCTLACELAEMREGMR